MNEIITTDDENVDDARLDEVVNDAVQIPLTMHDLNAVKNNGWINDQVIDSAIYKDIIQPRDDIIFVSAVVWNNRMPEYWGPQRRRRNRLPTIPQYLPEFRKVIIPVNFNNAHWSLCILDKQTKNCTFYCTLRYNIFSHNYASQLAKIKLICRLLLNGEEVEIINALDNSYLHQIDDHNCGPFTVMLAYKILNNESLFFGAPEAYAWRKYIYDYYIPFIETTNTNTNVTANFDELRIIEDTVKTEDSFITKKIKIEKTENDKFVDIKNGVKRKSTKGWDDDKESRNKKAKLCANIENLMEVDKNEKEDDDKFEGDGETLMAKEEEIQVRKIKNESFDEFCKRKRIGKKLAKSKNAYQKSVSSADKSLKENARIKECMKKKRASFPAEHKNESIEISQIAKDIVSQRVLKILRNKKSVSEAERRALQTEEERHKRLQKKSESMRKHRENETDEEKSHRLNTDKNQKEIKRTIERIEKQENLKKERAERLKNAQVKSSFIGKKRCTL
uniref:Ubiquitin-like protease family profile domain-containing protein n=1 Tax=Panagrolaimus superbus TaxID=310955 RepID=A0A914YS46_9BILA